MGQLEFGTDGVRARANTELTADFALQLGRAAVAVLELDQLVIGLDSRRSGPMLAAALAAGAASAGCDVLLGGVIPTPAVAIIAEHMGAGGAMISASHNAFADNGIKLFGEGGRKLNDKQQAAISTLIGVDPASVPEGVDVGTVEHRPDLMQTYLDRIAGVVPEGGLEGLSLVLDCANGAQSNWAESIFARTGATVEVIGDAPDGTNINSGVGSTAPDALCARVTETGAHLGLAFDGDADRLVAVDEKGRVIDGDRIIGLLATDMAASGNLTHNTVVVTVMTNQGFRIAMDERDIAVLDVGVGDRNVLEALESGGFAIGGEQSGHVIIPALSPTGDGLLTGLLLSDLLIRSEASLGTLADQMMTGLPQVLHNVRVTSDAQGLVDRLMPQVQRVEAGLSTGRVLVRPSGTEPLVRVMVEAGTEAEAETAALELVAEVERLSNPA